MKFLLLASLLLPSVASHRNDYRETLDASLIIVGVSSSWTITGNIELCDVVKFLRIGMHKGYDPDRLEVVVYETRVGRKEVTGDAALQIFIDFVTKKLVSPREALFKSNPEERVYRIHPRLELSNQRSKTPKRKLISYYRVAGLMLRINYLNPNIKLKYLILDSRYGDFTDVSELNGRERFLARQVVEGLYASASIHSMIGSI
jgi:hypothetical protein